MAVAEALRREVGETLSTDSTVPQCGQCTAACPAAPTSSTGRVALSCASSSPSRPSTCSVDVRRVALHRLRECQRGMPHGARRGRGDDPAAGRGAEEAPALPRAPGRGDRHEAPERPRHDRLDGLRRGHGRARLRAERRGRRRRRGLTPDARAPAPARLTRVTRARQGGLGDPVSSSPDVSRSPDAASSPAAAGRPFYPGCAMRQDQETFALTRAVAGGLDLELAEQPTPPVAATRAARPHRRATRAPSASSRPARPATRASRRAAPTRAAVGAAGRARPASGRGLRARAGLRALRRLLAEREPPWLRWPGRRAGRRRVPHLVPLAAQRLLRRPGRHVPFRDQGDATPARPRVARSAPVVTTCLLCRDNLRSAARRRGLPVKIHFWPEFFSAAGPADTSEGDRHD